MFKKKSVFKKGPEVYCPCGWAGMLDDLNHIQDNINTDLSEDHCPDCGRMLFENGKAIKLED